MARQIPKFLPKWAHMCPRRSQSLVYARIANFGILEDKYKEIREKAFDRIDTSKGDINKKQEESKDQLKRFDLFSSPISEKNLGQEGYSINAMTLDQIIQRLRIALEQKSEPYVYYLILERMQDIVINEPTTTGKNEILKILRALNYYRPKDEERIERQARNIGYVSENKDPLSKAHLRVIKQQSLVATSPIGHAFDHVNDNIRGTYLRSLVTDFVKTEEETMRKDIYDVLEIYKTLFRNLELVIHEELNRNNVSIRETLDILCAFSISGEASNVLLERIFEMIYPNLYQGKFNKHDLELIINHFPQDFWENSFEHSSKMNSFNGMIAEKLEEEVEGSSNRELLSFFQAFSNLKNFPKALLNKLLNRFVKMIEHNQMTKQELMNFLEIYAIMLQTDPLKAKELDSELLFAIVSKNIEDNFLKKKFKFSLQEIAVLYWIYATCEIYPGTSEGAVKSLENILNPMLDLFIEKYKHLSEEEKYDGIKQEMDLNDKDADLIIFYYKKCQENGIGENASTIIKTIESIKKKYDDRPENERKWFVF
ncbi:unnamed protein product [Moneuplotes crassus]|uniref:Uncharacterized protein n=1 Tax=Euplotes crassus TaxID=5936 RepID=A0AAD1UDP6_EUPCR|nr:unnamed protein product [Moneuplotes crassus]